MVGAEAARMAAAAMRKGTARESFVGLAAAAAAAESAERAEAARVGEQWRPRVRQIEVTAPPDQWGKPSFRVQLPEEEEYTPRFAFSSEPGRTPADRPLNAAKLVGWIGTEGSKVGGRAREELIA